MTTIELNKGIEHTRMVYPYVIVWDDTAMVEWLGDGLSSTEADEIDALVAEGCAAHNMHTLAGARQALADIENMVRGNWLSFRIERGHV